MAPSDSSALPEPDDRVLLTRIAGGDAGALGELYDRYSALLFTLSRRILDDPQDAEEVLQEAFLQVWKQAQGYKPGRSSVSTWLVMLTRSRAIDRLRSRQSRDRTLSGLWETRPEDRTSAEAVGNVLFQERKERLRSALRELPEEQRRVIALAFYEGLSQSEIAKKDGVPLGTVKTRTLLAMKKLRKALGQEIGDYL